MTEGAVMKSIDNLREWANGLHGVYINQVDHTIMVTTGWDNLPDMDSVSLRDHINGILDGIEREVADMVPLPVGADGVPIHVGDELETENGKRFKVRFLTLNDYQWLIDYSGWYPDKCRHHHVPTVEDVLREMLSKYDELRLGPSAFDPFELMAEYAARLRLAGDGE